MREASEEDLARLWPLLKTYQPYPDFTAFSKAALAKTGTVVCSDDDPLVAAVIGRWRDHLPIGWIKAFSGGRRPHAFAGELAHHLLDRGFEIALSPLLGRADATRFKRAGYAERESILIMTNSKLCVTDARGPAEIHPLLPGDIDAALAIDLASFDEFWRFGRAELLPLLDEGSAFVAMLNGHPVGYNIVSIAAGRGLLVRLAVHRDFARRGIGRQLVGKAINWFVDRGAPSALLATQRENKAARSLYGAFGFRKTGEQYLLVFPR
ncbi:MAG: GNAT family N-acetyltransferase [Actinobacteria bacterium]|nr:GNAT family N-acetyltransferase [Actinomycetota bacterium]